MEPMGEELRSNGLETIGGTDDPEFKDGFRYEDLRNYEWDPEVSAVITGIDFNVSYAKICLASIYIQRTKMWICTNDDQWSK